MKPEKELITLYELHQLRSGSKTVILRERVVIPRELLTELLQCWRSSHS